MYGQSMRVCAVHASVMPGVESLTNGMVQFQLGDLAHYVESEDGLFVYLPNDDFSECTSIALCEVVSTDPESGLCTLDIRRSVKSICPDKAARHWWRDRPFLFPVAKKTKKYGIIEAFAEAFNDRSWLERQLQDSVNWVFRPDLSKPTLNVTPGFVYVLKSLTEYKIGKAKDIEARKKQIEKQIGQNLELVHSISTNDYTRTEAELHIRYANFRTHGEWFNLSTVELTELLAIKNVNHEA